MHLFNSGVYQLRDIVDADLYTLCKSDQFVYPQSNQAEIIISPNPTRNNIHFKGLKPYKVILLNMQGQIIRDFFNTRDISLKEMSAGLYFIKFYDEDGHLLQTQKIILQ